MGCANRHRSCHEGTSLLNHIEVLRCSRFLFEFRLFLALFWQVEKAHDADLHCVDWNPHDNNLILTGSADNTVRLFDCRNLTSNGVGSPIYKFEGHNASVLSVQVRLPRF